MSTKTEKDPQAFIRRRFEKDGINIESLERRDFPEETIFVVKVSEGDLDAAVSVGNELDHDLERIGLDGFVTVRLSQKGTNVASNATSGISDSRATDLVTVLISRSRTSEVQPSLAYLPDTLQNISTATSPRHHLIFGRRGAGKTALMVEAKAIVTRDGHLTAWANLQTLRHETASRCFLWISKTVLESMQSSFRAAGKLPVVASGVAEALQEVESALSSAATADLVANRLVPRIQSLIRRFLSTKERRLFIFVDELHYLDIKEQPRLLDLLHSICRDADAWLKVAAIRHLARWFQASPPLGLETGHDADHIDLDVTLENPKHAKSFLEKMLKSYAKHVGISSIASVVSASALDRLVIASGAVPRDYLVLSANAIRQAQRREKSRVVGVQDVNKAAGVAAKVKLAELEDDAASREGRSHRVTLAAERIRNFCLEEKKFTYFRIDFRDKETHKDDYGLIQSLMDVRVLHLINPSISDEREAGRRSEVFMLDLSYYSSQRLKKHLKALDFESGNLVLKETGTSAPTKVGDAPNKLIGLLRRAPLFNLGLLTEKLAKGVKRERK